MQKKIILSLLVSSILSAQNIKLEQITVTSAAKSEQSIEDVTANVSVITAKKIEQRHYIDVTEALESVAGINFASNGGIGKTISVYLRGADSKKTLVLIDGIRYNDVTGLTGASFSDLMISDIEQIEIIKGAQSGIWGADASAGVINIITKKAKKGTHASLHGEYGSFNTKRYGASASHKTDDYYIKADIQKIDTNGFSSKVPNGDDIDMYEDDGYKNTTANIKFGFNIDSGSRVDISHTIIDAKNEYDSFTPDDIKNSSTKENFSKIAFNHKNSFSELDIYAGRSDFERDYPTDWTKEFDGEVTEYGIKTDTPYNDNDFIIIGADYKSFEHKNDLKQKYDNKALFITNSNEFNFLGSKTILSESFRFDDYDKFENKTTFKAGVKHFCKNIESLSISANIGTAYNVPTLYNLFDPTYGNPDLKPENTLSYDIGFGYRDITLTYFETKTKDMIDFDTAVWRYYNADATSKIKGLEIDYRSNIGESILYSVGYTYLDAKDAKGKMLQRRPQNTIKASVDYYGIKDLHVGINGEYIGKRVEYDYGTYDVKAQTGRYTVVNLVGNYTLNNNFSFYAKIENLFDKYYQTVDGYATAPLSAYAGIKANF